MMPAFYAQFSEWVGVLMGSGIGTSCWIALMLNVIFNGTPRAPMTLSFRNFFITSVIAFSLSKTDGLYRNVVA